MVAKDQKPSETKKEPENLEEDEISSSDSESSTIEGLKTDIVLPTELERLKIFTQKVARCAAKSFCETYVHPLVIQNPNPVPSKSETITVVSQNQGEGQTVITITREENEDSQTEAILNPKRENEEDKIPTMFDLKRQNEHDLKQTGIILDTIKGDNDEEAANYSNKEETLKATNDPLELDSKITTDKRQTGLSFDIGSILSSYLPCPSLAASGKKEEQDANIPKDQDSKSNEPPKPYNLNFSKSYTIEDQSQAKQKKSGSYQWKLPCATLPENWPYSKYENPCTPIPEVFFTPNAEDKKENEDNTCESDDCPSQQKEEPSIQKSTE